VIVGGIMFSLILTLFVIPAMYSYLSRKKHPVQFGDEASPALQPQKELVYEG
jgi:multidrug efflux pump